MLTAPLQYSGAGDCVVNQSEPAERHLSLIARLDQLPLSRYILGLITLLALGGAFELYDITLTATLSPALVRAGIFHADRRGILGMADQAAFAASTFAGLFVGTAFLAPLGDRIGRRLTFALSLVWYTIFGLVLALQSSVAGIDGFRFLAGIGIGVQLVTLDSYVAEFAPKAQRGIAFAVSQSVQFLGVPCAAVLSGVMLGRVPLGIEGWRWVAAAPAAGLIVAWLIYHRVPESPRWLADNGRIEDAAAVIALLKRHASSAGRHDLPAPQRVSEQEPAPPGGMALLWKPPYRRRTLMLVAFNVFQAAGFFGFTNWVPTLLAAQGVTVTKSLAYSAVIALMYPICPLLFTLFADRLERKTQLVIASGGVAVFGLLFASQRSPAVLVALGALVTLFGTLLSYSGHAYQSELYPTNIRARAVGFVYSFSRLSPIFTSFLIGALLRDFGANGVFVFIAGSMGVVVVVVGVFGPRTRGLALEQISPPA